jgi:uncharacterized membrane protein
MHNKRSFTDQFFLVLKGLGMGAANKVPGVSGGIVAFVVGFYEEFIYTLQKFDKNALKLFINGRFKSFHRYTNGSFMMPLLFGIIISYFSISILLDFLIKHYEILVWAGFFGMIIGSIYYIAKDYDDLSKKNIGFLLLGIITGVGISFLSPATENDNLLFVFFCGILGVSGMTLPGLSGSFILILIGNYVLLLVDSVNAINLTVADILQFDFSFLNMPERVHLLKIFFVFLAGSLVGLVTWAYILGFVLKSYKNETFAVIIGFITGSLGVVWPWKDKILKVGEDGQPLYDINNNLIIEGYQRYWPDFSTGHTWLAVLFVLIGLAIVLALDWYGKLNAPTYEDS